MPALCPINFSLAVFSLSGVTLEAYAASWLATSFLVELGNSDLLPGRLASLVELEAIGSAMEDILSKQMSGLL